MSEDESRSGEDLRSAAAHGLRWSALSRPLTEIVQLGGIVVLARLIAPGEFGRFAISVIAQEVALLLVTGGLSIALVQRKALGGEHAQTGMAMALIAGVALSALTFLAAGTIVAPIFGARTALLVRLMSPLCLIEALSTLPMVTLRRRMAFRRLSEIEVINAFTRVAACIVLAVAGLDGKALVLGILVGALSATVVACISAPPPLPRLHLAAARELLGPAARLWLATISWLGFANVDYAIIGARLGPLSTGYYYRAYTLAVEYQGKISAVMNEVGFPVLARTASTADLAVLYRKMIRVSTVIVFPMLVLLALAAPELVPFLFGSRWDGAVVPAQILALGGASMIIFNAVRTLFMATGRTSALVGFGWTQFLLYGSTVLLVAPLGITAVAIDAAVVHGVFAVIAYALMLRGTDEHPLARLWDDIAPAAISCVGLAAVAWPVSLALSAAGAPRPLWLAALGIVALPAYLGTLRLCFPETWRAQCAALARVLPSDRRLTAVKRRLATAAALH
jgi:lipopolysaccharide exporter